MEYSREVCDLVLGQFRHVHVRIGSIGEQAQFGVSQGDKFLTLGRKGDRLNTEIVRNCTEL